MIISILTPAVLAIGFRLRGAAKFQELLGRGATTARITVWAIPLIVLSWFLGLPIAVAVFLGIAAWIGCLLGWWESLDFGRHEGTWLRDFLLHTLRGVLWTAPMAAVLLAADMLLGISVYVPWMDISLTLGVKTSWWWMLGVGSLCGLIYEIGYQISEEHGTEIGEVLFGGLIGLALVLSTT